MIDVKPKFQAIVFIFATFIISAIEEYFIIRDSGMNNLLRIVALMWTPGLIGFALALIFDRNLQSLGFKNPDWKSTIAAYCVPAVAAMLIVLLLIASRVAEFEIGEDLILKKGSVHLVLAQALLILPTMGVAVSFLSAIGEEIGWRGFLTSKLKELSFNKRNLIIGLIWSMWHWPLILFANYASSEKPWVNVICFTVAVTSFSFFLGYLRSISNSVFPAGLAHAGHNVWMQAVIPVFYKAGPLVPYLGGESGLFCAIIYAAMALFIVRKYKPQN